MTETRGGRLYALILAAALAAAAGQGVAQEAGTAPGTSTSPAPMEAAPPALPPAAQSAPVPAEAATPTLVAPPAPASAVEAPAATPAARGVPAAPRIAASPDTAVPQRPAAVAPGASDKAAASPDAAAPDAAPVGASVAAAELPVDLSPWSMFLNADIVVKGVMAGLAFASLVTWTVFLAKSLEILRASRRLRHDLARILAATHLAAAASALGDRRGPAAAMVHAAAGEVAASMGVLDEGPQGLLPRVSSHLSRIEAGAGRRLTVGTGLLATIGATAPFVGLFGTVWGIMNSFIGISRAQTTNLAVVAPGIAEALLATAIGLVAAIPAVVIYNVFARWIAAYRARLADAAAGVERLVSRDLDHQRLAALPLARAAE